MNKMINKKIGKHKLPKSSNWMVYDLKHRIRRIKQEIKLGNEAKFSSLQSNIDDMGSDLLRLRQLESNYVSRSDDKLNEGRKLHQYRRTQDMMAENLNINHWVFSRKLMKKKYSIDNGLTVYRGDVCKRDNEPDSIKYQVVNVSLFNSEPVVNLHRLKYDLHRVHESYIAVDLKTFDREFKLYQVFVPDFSGSLPNQCPNCESEIYYNNGGFHAYNF